MEDKDLDKELENTELSSDTDFEEQPALENPDENFEENIEVQDLQEGVFESNTSGEQLPDEAVDDSIMQDDISDSENENFEQNEPIEDLITVRPVKFQEFEPSEPNRAIKKNLDIMQDISMHISVELGKTKATIKDVMDYKEGSIVELDKIAGEQVEVYVNNKLVARGEVIVIEDKFGVRVTTTSLPKNIQ